MNLVNLVSLAVTAVVVEDLEVPVSEVVEDVAALGMFIQQFS